MVRWSSLIVAATTYSTFGVWCIRSAMSSWRSVAWSSVSPSGSSSSSLATPTIAAFCPAPKVSVTLV